MLFQSFTLIELLAVIVILAIIALIAVPIIMNLIDNARKNSAKDSAYGYIEGIENYYAQKTLTDEGFQYSSEPYEIGSDGKLGDITLSLKGDKPTRGEITI